jgi:two-component system chemotaxis response regulator CheB
MIKLMSEVKVVRLLYPKKKPLNDEFAQGQTLKQIDSTIDVIAIGASTGGPPVLHIILSNLATGFSIPIVIVQHIATGFLEGMIEWLSKETPHLTLKIPKTGDRIQAGHVYFSPEDHHMEITPSRHFLITKINSNKVVKRPISHLFSSIAKIYAETSVGVLLTGMGNDGALGLKEMNLKGAVTLAQSKETSVVFGMPGEAVRLNAATHVLSPSEIASFLNMLSRN